MPIALRMEGLVKRYGDKVAVDGLSLAIEAGEFVTLLGASGCGKTTTLRMVAGFVEPDEGRVWLENADITSMRPALRNIGMVYQHYALFPHLTVFENVAFGLRVRGLPETEIRQRVHAMLDLVRLADCNARLPGTLSGGQQQRVAVARALVIQPRLLLLDEPLSNLDAKLRRGMQIELRRLQRELGITTVCVTHDQSEALGISDRIAVMNNGSIEQVDRPETLYRHPATPFVAGFIGQANVLAATLTSAGSGRLQLTVEGKWNLSAPAECASRSAAGARVLVVIRPESIVFHEREGPGTVPGRVLDVIYGGASLLYRVALMDEIIIVAEQPNSRKLSPFRPDAPVWVEAQPDALTILWQ